MIPASITAVRDPSLTATITRRTPLLYSEGAAPDQDRPAQVRAGSSVAWLGGRIAVVQDDALFLALLDPVSGRVDALPLPAGQDGLRLFDDLRGNRLGKRDFEACTGVPTPQGEALWIFGSGSAPRRDCIAIVRPQGAVEIFEAGAFYRALRAEKAFSGSELNVEGAVFREGCIRLFNRGNGAPIGELLPANASCDIPLQALESHLRRTAPHAVPAILRPTRYDLGRLNGAPLTFTDAVAVEDRILYLAAAEDSADAITDGEVAGSAIGVIDHAGNCRWIELRDRDGSLSRIKAEGLCAVPGCATRLYLVSDADDPARPSELCEAVLSGDW